MFDDLIQAVQASIEGALSEVNTMVPARIVSYDPARNRAVVQPIMPKRLADGRVLSAPQVLEVPIVWTTSGGATLTMPVAAGDGVMLSFSQRSLDGWLSGSTDAPDDPRRFDISDAVAIPGLSSTRPAVDTENLVLSFGEASITLTPSGEIILKGTKITLDSPLTETPTGEVRAGDINLKTHRHLGVEPGGGTSGVSTP